MSANPKNISFLGLLKFVGMFAIIMFIAAIYNGTKYREKLEQQKKTEISKDEFAQQPFPAKFNNLAKELNYPKYKGLNWLSDISSVKKQFPSENKLNCDIKICVSKIPSVRNSTICKIKSGLKYFNISELSDDSMGFVDIFKYMNTKSEVYDSRFELTSVANGCAIFYKGLYVAQMNWVDSALNKEEVLFDVQKNWKLEQSNEYHANRKYDLEEGLTKNYKFSSIDGLFFISFYPNNVISFYYHPLLIKYLTDEIEGEALVELKKLIEHQENEIRKKTEKNKDKI